MHVLVTGARGKVGRAAVASLQAAGHDVRATDLHRPVYEWEEPGTAPYVQADVTDGADAFALLRGIDAVVHAAAIPEPSRNTPHTVFRNNLMGTFNLVEAAVRLGVRRFVHLSSETVPGYSFPERPYLPEYAPVDEDHPIRPQDPYALSKHFGEQLMDAAVRRSDLRCISIRPSWVLWEGNYALSLGPQLHDASLGAGNLWSYTDLDDLADALVTAAASDLPDHEVLYVAAPDNSVGGHFADLLARYHGDRIPLRELTREDASGISCRKAERLLGYRPRRSWRDHLTPAGEPLRPPPAVP
jgi:nucleoside-diphosphate-sugar epimerase